MTKYILPSKSQSKKSEYANTIGAYYNDYQAEINRVQGNNDASDDWKIPYLQAARNQKLNNIAAAQAAADQQAFENQLALDKLAISSSKSYRSGSHSGGSGRRSSGSGGNNDNNNNTPKNLFGPAPATKLNDVDASYQVGMNRTTTGQLATIQRLYNNGQITEAQATALISKFNLG